MNKWNFPVSSNAPGRGFADPGLATFGGHELTSLARETCQNSLDARLGSTQPVEVEFEHYDISATDFPGFEAYLEALEGSFAYWTSDRSEKAHAFLDHAVETMRKQKVSVLRISDYNTTGLSEPYENRFGGWNILTKLDGGATKGGDSAGSYGIGKNAPFTASDLHLVFYRTQTQAGERAAQGVARIPAYPLDPEKEVSTQIAGVGYYGNPDYNGPVESIPVLDALERRLTPGTDVFVFGFMDRRGWQTAIAAEILESFLAAIYDGRLIVRVQGEEISKATLSDVVEKYRTKAKNAWDYYKVLTQPERVKDYETEFEGLGKLHLQVITDPAEKLNRKILVIRSSGMKLFAIDRISSSIMFTGILELEGMELNKYFREMESPAHDRWDPGRHSNPTQAKRYAANLRRWVVERVYDASAYLSGETMEMTGLGHFLQDTEEGNGTIAEEGPHPKPPEVSERPLPPSGSGASHRQPSPDAPEAPILQGKKPPRSKGRRGQSERAAGSSPTAAQSGRRREYEHPLRRARIIRRQKGGYRLVFESAFQIAEGHLTIHTIGENGQRSWPLEILSVTPVTDNLVCRAAGREIDFSGLPSFEKIVVDFDILDPEEYVMGVALYED